MHTTKNTRSVLCPYMCMHLYSLAFRIHSFLLLLLHIACCHFSVPRHIDYEPIGQLMKPIKNIAFERQYLPLYYLIIMFLVTYILFTVTIWSRPSKYSSKCKNLSRCLRSLITPIVTNKWDHPACCFMSGDSTNILPAVK